MTFQYVIEVDNGRETAEGGPYVAQVVGQPFRVEAATPVLALAALARVLERWHAGGSDDYLNQGGRLRS